MFIISRPCTVLKQNAAQSINTDVNKIKDDNIIKINNNIFNIEILPTNLIKLDITR
jgi:hypothetical protein